MSEEIFEVFRQERRGQPMEHAGSVVAPDADFAEAWAREQYGRRGESVALWLVPRDAIRDVEDWADEFDLKYRRVDGYSIKARLKEARERSCCSDWLTTSSCWAGATRSGRGSRRCSRRTSPSRRSRRTRSATHAPSTSCLTDDADALAFDRSLEEYRCAPLVELRLLDWAHAIARRWLYEEADRIRIEALIGDDDTAVAGLAAKIDREEAYHRMHAELWHARLCDEPRFREAVAELWPYALGVVLPEQRAELARRVGLDEVAAVERGTHTDELAELWDEMTSVRRSAPAGSQW